MIRNISNMIALRASQLNWVYILACMYTMLYIKYNLWRWNWVWTCTYANCTSKGPTKGKWLFLLLARNNNRPVWNREMQMWNSLSLYAVQFYMFTFGDEDTINMVYAQPNCMGMLEIIFLVSLESFQWGGVHGLWFHGIWTCGAKVLEYWMISSVKIKLSRSWKFLRNWNVPLVLLERSWWAGFNGIYLVRFGSRMWEILILKWFLLVKIQRNSKKPGFGRKNQKWRMWEYLGQRHRPH